FLLFIPSPVLLSFPTRRSSDLLNMLMFFKGLSLSTPINSAVSMTVTPILLLVMSAIFLKIRITGLKVIGITMGLLGALVLILFQNKTQPNAPNIPLGNLLFVLNAISYAFYIILAKPLISKYKPGTLLKFFFLIAFLINLPIGFSEVVEIQWQLLTLSQVIKISFLVLTCNFLTYAFS